MNGAALDERTLRRIIATLVALAVLAERAAGRSFPVRWLVLTILRYGEAVALDYVADTTGMDWSCFEHEVEPGNSPIDAAILAWRFRMLAAMLSALLGSAWYDDGWTTGRDAAPSGLALGIDDLRFVVMADGWAQGAYDTS